MASRAPVLAKPIPKAKPTAKSSALKTNKNASSSKPSNAKAKDSVVKSAVVKSTLVKATVAKPVAVKPVSSKASLVKTSAASKSSGTKTLSATAASTVTSVSKSLSANVNGKLGKPADSKLALLPKSGKALSSKPHASSSDPALLEDVSKMTGTASFEPAVPKPRRRSKGEIRTRIYWAVFNQSLRRVAVFEFDQRVEAEKRADKLAKASGEHHFIQKIKAIVQ